LWGYWTARDEEEVGNGTERVAPGTGKSVVNPTNAFTGLSCPLAQQHPYESAPPGSRLRADSWELPNEEKPTTLKKRSKHC
jgi:hypothetical protein